MSDQRPPWPGLTGADGVAFARGLHLAELEARQGLPGLSAAARLAERVNPGRVRHVAIVRDIDGAACEIGADYASVKIGPYRFEREALPTLLAAIGESIWLAGIIEQQIREDDDDGR